MRLQDYLRSLSPKQKVDFASRVGVQKIYLHQIAGGVEPSPLIAARIQRQSDGIVTVYELRPTDAHEIWPQENQPAPVAQGVSGLSASSEPVTP